LLSVSAEISLVSFKPVIPMQLLWVGHIHNKLTCC